MDTNTYKRYTAEQCLQTQTSGNLYKGHDSVLHRDVMLYISEFDVSVDSGPSVIQAVKNGSRLPEDRFMHVWDIEVDTLSIMIVLKPEVGYFLADELDTHSLKLDEILVLIRQLGQSMLESSKDGIQGFSVYANNIWIQGLNQPIIINYWNHDDTLWSGAGGLGRLLYQLVLRTKKIPTDLDTIDTSLMHALRITPDAKREAVSKWVRAALQDRKSLPVLLKGLDQLLLTHQEQDKYEEADAYEELIIAEKQYVAPVQELTPRRPEIKRKPKEVLVIPKVENKLKMGKKQKWIIVAVILSGLLVTEIFAVQLLRKPDTPSKQPDVIKAPAVQIPVPAPAPVVTAPAVPAPTAPKPLTDQETAIVPNLKGMALADAEKALLSLDLKYKYYIEVNEQSPGTVFKQEIQADQKVAKFTEVIFYVGK